MSKIARVTLAFIAATSLLAPAVAQKPAAKPPAESAAEHSMFARDRGGTKTFYDSTRFDLSALPRYRPAQKVSGVLRVSGANYINDSPLGRWWAEAFKKFQPGVRIIYNTPSAAIAVPSLYFGEAEIGMNHEPSFYDYLAFARVVGSDPIGFSVVTGSYNLAGWQNTIVIAVHKSNPIAGLTMDQLDGIFGSVRDGGWIGSSWHPEFARGAEKDIRTWGQLGVGGPLGQQRIHVYGYTPRYATALEFSNKLLHGSDKWNEDLRAFGNYRRSDGTIYGQADQISDKLRSDPAGIAIIRYTDHVGKDFKVLPLAPRTGAPFVPYTLDTVRDRSYPLWGDQSFWVAVKPGGKLDPKVREFIRFVLSRDGQELVVRDGKYLPLTGEAAAQELAKLERTGR